MADAHDPSPSASRSYASSGSTSHEAADFECNICFDLAQDPVVTLCGHLFCWPCLYKWLRVHSQSQECPVCKALVKEETVIPLYGRGKTRNDPRSKPVPGVEIPNRPAGHRPETASPPADHNFSNLVFGLIGGFIPIASASLGNIGISAGFGGLLLPFFVQFQGFPYTGVSSASPGYRDGYNGSDSSRNRDSARGREDRQGSEEDDENLKKLLLIILFFVCIVFLTM